MKKYIQNLTVLDLIVSTFLAFMFTVAPDFIKTGKHTYTARSMGMAVLLIILFLFLAMFFRLLLSVPAGNRKRNGAGKAFAAAENLLSYKDALFILAFIMLLFWLPTLISLYPGTAINDTWGQLTQYVYTFYSGSRLHIEYLGDHHPVVTTLIMGGVIIPLTTITGNLQAAFFIYVLVQSFLTCLAFSYTLTYMHDKLRVGTGFTLTAFLIYCILPIFPASSQVIGKDSLAAWIFVYFTVFIIEIVRTGGEWLNTGFNCCIFLAVLWLCCATKKVGVYVTVLTLAVLAFTVSKHRDRILACAAVIFLIFNVLWPRIMTAAGITSGGKTEMLSIPFQMTARYVKENPDDITKEEYKAIDNILYISSLPDRYDPVSADPVKGFASYERFQTSDYVNYIKAWVSQGKRHPDSYINALLAQESGWFSRTEYIPLLNMDWHSQLNTQIFSEEVTVRPEQIKTAADRYQKMIDRLYRIPAAGILFTYGFYAALLPAFIICTLFTRKRAARKGDDEQRSSNKQRGIHPWAAAVPVFLSIALGCWLAPVSIHFEGRRYLFPVTYTVVVLLAFCRWWMMGGADTADTEKEE